MDETNQKSAFAEVKARLGPQPVRIAAIALGVVMLGIVSIAGWRVYTGNAPEQERITATRLLQTRTAQASEQLVEKTKGIESAQQQTIDQLQVVQDQLQAMQQSLTAQRAETKRTADQVASLTGSLDALKQSFASAQAQETADTPAVKKERPAAAKIRNAQAKYRPKAVRKKGKARR